MSELNVPEAAQINSIQGRSGSFKRSGSLELKKTGKIHSSFANTNSISHVLDFKCSLCEIDPEAAVSKCITCQALLCESHSHVHAKLKSTRSHQLVDLNSVQMMINAEQEARASPRSRPSAQAAAYSLQGTMQSDAFHSSARVAHVFSQDETCKTHFRRKNDWFCLDCRIPICSECAESDHRHHRTCLTEAEHAFFLKMFNAPRSPSGASENDGLGDDEEDFKNNVIIKSSALYQHRRNDVEEAIDKLQQMIREIQKQEDYALGKIRIVEGEIRAFFDEKVAGLVERRKNSMLEFLQRLEKGKKTR